MDIKELVRPIVELPHIISRISAEVDFFSQDYAKSAVGKHRSIAGLLSVPDEHGVKDDYIREILENMAVEDGDAHNKLEEIKAEIVSAIKSATDAKDNVATMGDYWSNLVQRLTQENQATEARVNELTERLKEHALNDPVVRDKVWAITGGKCFYCDVDLVRGENVSGEDRPRLYHVDHLVPKANGGPDHMSNYVPACQRCNISKNAKSYVEFLAWRKAQQDQPQLAVIEGGAA